MMSSLDLPDRSLAVVIIEATVCLAMTIISITGNTLVCLAVYKNPKLRSTTNLYIIALAASDLLCATVEMPLASAVLITGRWDFGDALCQIQGFVDVFVTYTTPATMGLTAFNRYTRIVKTHNYNKIFSPRRSKIWLSCVWLSLAFYLLIGRVTNLNRFEFIPGYAVCSVSFASRERKFAHYFYVFGLFSVLPFFIACISYYKVFRKLRQHNRQVGPSLALEDTNNPRTGRISVQEINISRTLSYVAAGFLFCWIPLWSFACWKRSSPETAPRVVELFVSLMLFLSASINPFIYTATSGVFRGEFCKLLCWWKVARIAPVKRKANNEVEQQQDEANV
ncbi:hypothetical protein OS493_023057 [Desmophyllum pertusum]|uniref:G-protein coupled receptors family 1 profile domain-containing protein n=1 Tax=Desmophyllum pertusum TaxID=174260 RepID=A0A9W9YYF2_9CNID|nr:hypothetical protein OS493_023057 [Desmophyllum pertusum]